MSEVKNGNLDAMIPLFDTYNIKLYNFFLRLTRNKETSEDLTQNVFSRILSYRTSYQEGASFRTWIYQMARNVHIDHYHKNKFLISDYKSADEIGIDASDALEEMEKKEKQFALYEALDQLDQDQKEIIELSRFQGLKYQEISEITGNSVTAIKVKVHRAMNKLRGLYFELV